MGCRSANDSSAERWSDLVASNEDGAEGRKGELLPPELRSFSPPLDPARWTGRCDGEDCQHYVNEKESESASRADNFYVDNLP